MPAFPRSDVFPPPALPAPSGAKRNWGSEANQMHKPPKGATENFSLRLSYCQRCPVLSLHTP